MTGNVLQRLALNLLADHDARVPGQWFVRPRELTIAQAYELQSEIARLRQDRGEKVIGYKIGCTSRVVQDQLGVSEPIFGRVFDTACFHSGVQLSYARFASLAVEGEFAVRLRHDLIGLALTEEQCQEAIEAVFPVIELHHYVLHRAGPAGPELVASNGMHAGVVLPSEMAGPDPSDLVPGLLIRIGGATSAVDSCGSMRSPSGRLRWLAERLAGLGLGLQRGQIVLTGSPMRLFPVSAGSKIEVEAPLLGKSYAEVVP
jgi:2-keto-4-pentenoate hydratase